MHEKQVPPLRSLRSAPVGMTGRLPWRAELASGAVLAFHLQTPDLASSSGIFVAAPLLVGFGNNRGNREMASSRIHRDKSQVGRAYVLAAVVHVIFYPGFPPTSIEVR